MRQSEISYAAPDGDEKDFEKRWSAWQAKNRIEEEVFRRKARAILISVLLVGLAVSGYFLLTRGALGR
jgi:hypothetical protein